MKRPVTTRVLLLSVALALTACGGGGGDTASVDTAQPVEVVVDGDTNTDAAWYYPEPKDAAKEITGRVAFWKGVEVTS